MSDKQTFTCHFCGKKFSAYDWADAHEARNAHIRNACPGKPEVLVTPDDFVSR